MSDEPTIDALPPRVLIVMPDQWTRALLRAALREVGYDAVGSRGLREAIRVRPDEPDRGPVRLLVVDHDAVVPGAERVLEQLRLRYASADAILVKRAMKPAPAGAWRVTLQRPVSVADIVVAVQASLPLPVAAQHPVD